VCGELLRIDLSVYATLETYNYHLQNNFLGYLMYAVIGKQSIHPIGMQYAQYNSKGHSLITLTFYYTECNIAQDALHVYFYEMLSLIFHICVISRLIFGYSTRIKYLKNRINIYILTASNVNV